MWQAELGSFQVSLFSFVFITSCNYSFLPQGHCSHWFLSREHQLSSWSRLFLLFHRPWLSGDSWLPCSNALCGPQLYSTPHRGTGDWSVWLVTSPISPSTWWSPPGHTLCVCFCSPWNPLSHRSACTYQCLSLGWGKNEWFLINISPTSKTACRTKHPLSGTSGLWVDCAHTRSLLNKPAQIQWIFLSVRSTASTVRLK